MHYSLRAYFPYGTEGTIQRKINAHQPSISYHRLSTHAHAPANIKRQNRSYVESMRTRPIHAATRYPSGAPHRNQSHRTHTTRMRAARLHAARCYTQIWNGASVKKEKEMERWSLKRKRSTQESHYRRISAPQNIAAQAASGKYQHISTIINENASSKNSKKTSTSRQRINIKRIGASVGTWRRNIGIYLTDDRDTSIVRATHLTAANLTSRRKKSKKANLSTRMRTGDGRALKKKIMKVAKADIKEGARRWKEYLHRLQQKEGRKAGRRRWSTSMKSVEKMKKKERNEKKKKNQSKRKRNQSKKKKEGERKKKGLTARSEGRRKKSGEGKRGAATRMA